MRNIFITKIDFIEADDEDINIQVHPQFSRTPPPVLHDSAGKRVSKKVATELIRGVTFIKPGGTRITVGYSKQAQEVLGISYDVVGSMQTEMRQLEDVITRQQRGISDLKFIIHIVNRWSWWERLKRVFTGNEDITI